VLAYPVRLVSPIALQPCRRLPLPFSVVRPERAPGTFSIDLGNFVLPDGDTITNVTYASGNLVSGNFSSVSWNGTDAVFTGSTASDYSAIGGRNVVFNVTEAPSTVPEPSFIWLCTIVGGLLVTIKKLRHA
jgi:hypothetical protein